MQRVLCGSCVAHETDSWVAHQLGCCFRRHIVLIFRRRDQINHFHDFAHCPTRGLGAGADEGLLARWDGDHRCWAVAPCSSITGSAANDVLTGVTLEFLQRVKRG